MLTIFGLWFPGLLQGNPGSANYQHKVLFIRQATHDFPPSSQPRSLFPSRKSKASPQAILWNLLANFSSSNQESLFLMWFFVCSSGYPKLHPLPPPLPPSLLYLFPASFWPFCFGLSNFVITFFACGCYGKIFWMRLIYLYVCGRSFFFTSASACACASSYSYLLSRSAISTSSSDVASVSAAVFDIKWRA